MKTVLSCRILVVSLAMLATLPLSAQRQMEALGRGLIAVRKSSTEVYLGWRLLGDDPADVGFNLYRSTNGETAVRLNWRPLTATTDYTDSLTASELAASSYTWHVCPVVDGVEQVASVPFTLPAAAPVKQYFSLPLRSDTGPDGPYGVKFCWVGDLDGDGEYDFVVDRLSTRAVSSEYAANEQFLEAYRRDGTFLWRMAMGPNSRNQYAHKPGSSAISTGDTDNVTVYDLDGDGRAEVIVRTANGVTVTNAAGEQVAAVTHSDDLVQFISIIDGLTGEERARAVVPNGWKNTEDDENPLTNKAAILYCDGKRPSVLFYGKTRVPSGKFYYSFTTWDYRDGQLTQRWTLAQDQDVLPGAESHMIRIADVDNDGRDEICDIGQVIDDDGTRLFYIPEVSHGDRIHLADIDPDRPGLETFIIQQNNPSMLATALYESGTGAMIRKWYMTGIGDVGRGVALDITPATRGYEFFSTQPGIFDAKGNRIYENSVWPPEGLWWDGDLGREFIDGAGSGAYNPIITKFNPDTGGVDRLFTMYNDWGSYSTRNAYGGRPAFWGDILGDWREEVVVVASDYSELRIYTTNIPAETRLYTLMHNPQYRMQTTTKGYVQASYVDYCLGYDMTPPPPPPMVPADLTWSGAASGQWTADAVDNWVRDSVTIGATPSPAAYTEGSSVLFDLSGSHAAPVVLAGDLAPGEVTVYSDKDYLFSGEGSLNGGMTLTKAGAGTLTLAGSHAYTGATTVWDGALVVDGVLAGSPVTVRGGTWGGALAAGRTGGRLAGHGTIGQRVTLCYRGALIPGSGVQDVGTLTLDGGLAAEDGSVLVFDLSGDPAGAVNPSDRLVINGDLVLSGVVAVVVNAIDGALAPGSYTLLTCTGTITGGADNLSVTLPEGVPGTISLESGALMLAVPETRAASAGVTWTGGRNGNVWDLSLTANWQAGGVADVFVAGDAVILDDTGAANAGITLSQTLPVSGLTVSGTVNYTLSGPGSISGPGGLVKDGTGTLTLSGGAHAYTGSTVVNGGVLVVAELANGGEASSIGASSSAAGNLVLDGGTLSLLGEQTNTDRSLVIGPGGATIDIPVSTSAMRIGGVLSGSGPLVKTGDGTLILGSANTYAGGTIIREGTLLLASSEVNSEGPGSGTVSLQGGVLSMSDVRGWETAAWALEVPSGHSGRLEADGRCYLGGPLTGGGDFVYYTPYVRSELQGDWSAFTGRIFATGSDFRMGNSRGFPAAELNIAGGTYAYYQGAVSGSGLTVPVGALSGPADSFLQGGPTGGRTVTWQVGARNTDTTFAGVIADRTGPSALAKVGSGTLTLTGANTYTGTTTVSGGALIVEGRLGVTAVTVNAGGQVGGSGSLGGTLAVKSGASWLMPTATDAGLTVTGDVTLSGTVTVVPPSGFVPGAGRYVLFTTEGSVSNSATFVWGGEPGVTIDTSGAGQIAVVVSDDPVSQRDLVWTGANGAAWDTVTQNWTADGVAAVFGAGDHVTFDDTMQNTTVLIAGAVEPGSVTVDISGSLTISATGDGISGAAALVKKGTGTLDFTSVQSCTGGTVLQDGTLNIGTNVNWGVPGLGPVTLEGGTLSADGYSNGNTLVYDQPIIVPEGAAATLRTPNRFRLNGAVSGSGVLTVGIVTNTSRADFQNDFRGFSGELHLTGSGTIRLGISALGTNQPLFPAAGWADTMLSVDGVSVAPTITYNGTLSIGALASTGSTGTLGGGSGGTVTWSLGGKNLDTHFGGTITGNAALAKTGNGRLTLSGTHTYTGTTTVASGTLVVTGVLPAGAVSVSAGATFGGTGAAGGSVTFASGSTLGFGATPTGLSGLALAGSATLDGIITVTPVLLEGATALVPGKWTILTATGGLEGMPTFIWSDPTGSGLLATIETTPEGTVTLTLAFPYSLLEQWRLDHFGTTENAGEAADTTDPDGDGIANLLEYAFGGDPLAPDVSLLPSVAIADDHLVITFWRNDDAALRYRVEATNDLRDSSWSEIWPTATDDGSATGWILVTDPVSVSTQSRRFLRVTVSY